MMCKRVAMCLMWATSMLCTPASASPSNFLSRIQFSEGLVNPGSSPYIDLTALDTEQGHALFPGGKTSHKLGGVDGDRRENSRSIPAIPKSNTFATTGGGGGAKKSHMDVSEMLQRALEDIVVKQDHTFASMLSHHLRFLEENLVGGEVDVEELLRFDEAENSSSVVQLPLDYSDDGGDDVDYEALGNVEQLCFNEYVCGHCLLGKRHAG